MLYLMYSMKESKEFIHLLKEIDPSCSVHVERGNDSLYVQGITEDIPCLLEIQIDSEKLKQLYGFLNQPEFARLKILKYI